MKSRLEEQGFHRVETKTGLSFFLIPNNSIAYIGSRLVEDLMIEAGNKNARICLHHGPGDLLHDMIILEHHGQNFPVHRHPHKAETIAVLMGRLKTECFTDAGASFFSHEAYNGSIIRIPANTWHKNIIDTKYCVYRETKEGPFDPQTDREFFIKREL